MKTTNVLALFAVLIGCTGDAPPLAPPSEPPNDEADGVETGRRVISIGSDALGTARQIAAQHGATIDIVEMNEDVAIIGFPAEHFRDLSEAVHTEHHRCGGFALHDSLDDALVSLRAKDYETVRSLATDYTLDDGPTVNAVVPTIAPARILTTIQQLSMMKNRYYTSTTGAAASTWLRDTWRGLTSRTDVTVELVDHGYAQKSVILKIPGTTRANEVVVLGGHLDSIASGGATSTAPGADDDASGIATLTEIARVLLAKDYRPARTIQFIGYAAEEVGLRGSKAIATDYKTRGVSVVGVALAACARGGRARQQRILAGHPALALPAQPRRHPILHAGRAQHTRPAHLDQRRALGIPKWIERDRQRAQIGRRTAITTRHRSLLAYSVGNHPQIEGDSVYSLERTQTTDYSSPLRSFPLCRAKNDLRKREVPHHASGTRTSTVVPSPSAERMRHSPPISRARSRIFSRPSEPRVL